MSRCLKCPAPADILLFGAAPHWPSGLGLNLCALHAARALDTGEAHIASDTPLPPPVAVSLGVSIGEGLTAAGAFFAVLLLAFLLLRLA